MAVMVHLWGFVKRQAILIPSQCFAYAGEVALLNARTVLMGDRSGRDDLAVNWAEPRPVCHRWQFLTRIFAARELHFAVLERPSYKRGERGR